MEMPQHQLSIIERLSLSVDQSLARLNTFTLSFQLFLSHLFKRIPDVFANHVSVVCIVPVSSDSDIASGVAVILYLPLWDRA